MLIMAELKDSLNFSSSILTKASSMFLNTVLPKLARKMGALFSIVSVVVNDTFPIGYLVGFGLDHLATMILTQGAFYDPGTIVYDVHAVFSIGDRH